MTLPDNTTFVRPGLDDPRGGIVATFYHWGTNWAWKVQYHLTSDDALIQHIVTNAFDAPISDRAFHLLNDPNEG